MTSKSVFNFTYTDTCMLFKKSLYNHNSFIKAILFSKVEWKILCKEHYDAVLIIFLFRCAKFIYLSIFFPCLRKNIQKALVFSFVVATATKMFAVVGKAKFYI